jgi:hypothetical protein
MTILAGVYSEDGKWWKTKGSPFWGIKTDKRCQCPPLVLYMDVYMRNMQILDTVLVALKQNAINRIALRGKIRNGIGVKEMMFANLSKTVRLRKAY